MKTISQQIRCARKRANLTQAELSALVNIAQGDISKLERGQTNVRLSTIEKVAAALSLDLVAVPRKFRSKILDIIRDDSEPMVDKTLLEKFGVPDED